MTKLLLAALLVVSGSASATRVQDVKDPRPGHQVVDETGTLTLEDIAAIDEAATAGSMVGELMVVVVSSTDGAAPRQWTTDVFNRFAVDTKNRNKGLLLMAALGDRKAEIVIGDGWPGATTNTTDDVMRSIVVAHMKRGDPRGAIVEAARALSQKLLQDPKAMEEAAARKAEEEALRALAAKVPDPRKARGAVDAGKLLGAADQKAIAKARAAAAPDMTLAVVVLAKVERDAQSLAEAIFERYPLDGERGRGALLVVFAEPALPKIIAGPAYPALYVDQKRSDLGIAFTGALKGGTRMGTAIADMTRSLATLGSDLPAWQEAKAKAEAEEAARREAAWNEKVRAQTEAANVARAAQQQAIFEEERKTSEDRMIYAGGGAGLLGAATAARLFARYRRRKCPKCSAQMDRLSEDADDAHLSGSEQREEELGSVNYDIWLCPECSTTVKTRWAAILTGYSTCPRCSAKTVSTTSRTISAATYSSTGLAEVTRSCQACPFHSTERRTIPRKQRSSSSSGSRSSFGSSSGSRSGGSSSGRGSSGSW